MSLLPIAIATFALLCQIAVVCGADTAPEGTSNGLRGVSTYPGERRIDAANNIVDAEHQFDAHRLIQAVKGGPFILSQPMAFQITMYIFLSIIVLSQMALFFYFVIHRSRCVIKLAQPDYICIMIAASVVTTAACFLFIHISQAGCLVREPLIFMSLTLMGATVAARAWRISMLMANPFMNAADVHNGFNHTEKARRFVMEAISTLSGFDCPCLPSRILERRQTARRSRSTAFHVEINNFQMMTAIAILCVPQITLQVLIMGVPVLRSQSTLSYYDYFGLSIGQYECRTSLSGSLMLALSILLVVITFGCAYLLNLRPIDDKLPSIVDEFQQLKRSFTLVGQVLVLTAPIIAMTYCHQTPAIRAYASACAVLGVNLSLTHSIAFDKVNALRTNAKYMRMSIVGASTRSVKDSVADAVKTARLTLSIGRAEETLSLVDETLEMWKGRGKQRAQSSSGKKVEIASGFTRSDLNQLDQDELRSVLELLLIKGDALHNIYGKDLTHAAEMNVNAMRIFENCPAAREMKDVSIMFPVYSRIAIFLKAGAIQQDDACSLEMQLAKRLVFETRLQSYHLARALANLAEWYGRSGELDKAFQCFETMRNVYLPKEHPPLLAKAYFINRCAITFAASALWYLRQGKTDKAVDRCDEVEREILPAFDKKDMLGSFHIFGPIIRVLRGCGEVDKAREFYFKWSPPGIENHFAVGMLHRPMCLLLTICDGSSAEYDMENEEKVASDIELALSFDTPDMTNLVYLCDGWSVKSMAAELCLHLARRLKHGDVSRAKLLERGIEMSTRCDQQTKTSDGCIKHFMAHDGHKGIHSRLLALSMNDNSLEDEKSMCEGNKVSSQLPTNYSSVNVTASINMGLTKWASQLNVSSTSQKDDQNNKVTSNHLVVSGTSQTESSDLDCSTNSDKKRLLASRILKKRRKDSRATRSSKESKGLSVSFGSGEHSLDRSSR